MGFNGKSHTYGTFCSSKTVNFKGVYNWHIVRRKLDFTLHWNVANFFPSSLRMENSNRFMHIFVIFFQDSLWEEMQEFMVEINVSILDITISICGGGWGHCFIFWIFSYPGSIAHDMPCSDALGLQTSGCNYIWKWNSLQL